MKAMTRSTTSSTYCGKALAGSSLLKKKRCKVEFESSSTESEDSKSESDSSEELFFNENPKLPILTTSRGKLESERILEVLSEDYRPERKCQQQPMRVQQIALFLIDTRFISLEDLQVDGNGTYIYNERYSQTYLSARQSRARRQFLSRQINIPANSLFI